jgi:hypothetical protein
MLAEQRRPNGAEQADAVNRDVVRNCRHLCNGMALIFVAWILAFGLKFAFKMLEKPCRVDSWMCPAAHWPETVTNVTTIVMCSASGLLVVSSLLYSRRILNECVKKQLSFQSLPQLVDQRNLRLVDVLMLFAGIEALICVLVAEAKLVDIFYPFVVATIAILVLLCWGVSSHIVKLVALKPPRS